jgi:hypothetical protein
MIEFKETSDGYLEIESSDLIKIIDMMDNSEETYGFKRVIEMCQKYTMAGLTPRILWEENSDRLRIRCDELIGKKLH